VSDLLEDLQAGRRRAAWPDASVSGGWRVDASVKEEILALFRAENTTTSLGDAFHFRDRVSLPTLPPPDGVRVVPGGTTIRAGVHLEPKVVVMPPSYVNIGAWVGAGSMVDSPVVVGACAHIGEGVHR
jgi:2,3,4,5-tetrahydropyridine-2-carboxylate N-succinyltransferase